jgi:hypothetical protein
LKISIHSSRLHDRPRSLHLCIVCPDPSQGLAHEIKVFAYLLQHLSRFENMKKLEMNLDNYQRYLPIPRLRDLEIPQQKLDRVHTLQMLPFSPYLWNMCPNVVSLAAHFPRDDMGLFAPTQIFTPLENIMMLRSADFTKLRHLRIDSEDDLLSGKRISSSDVKHLNKYLQFWQISQKPHHKLRVYI